jgi:hypothetical protein
MLLSPSTETVSERGLGRTRGSSAGSGIIALKRVGFKGVTTMKMMSSTRRMSMKGVTLMLGAFVAARGCVMACCLPVPGWADGGTLRPESGQSPDSMWASFA